MNKEEIGFPTRLLYAVVVSLVVGVPVSLLPGLGGVWKAVLVGGLVAFVATEWKRRDK